MDQQNRTHQKKTDGGTIRDAVQQETKEHDDGDRVSTYGCQVVDTSAGNLLSHWWPHTKQAKRKLRM